jgi:signal peptidase II
MGIVQYCIILDQITKYLSRAYIKKPITLIKDFLSLHLQKNYGISLGFLSNLPEEYMFYLKIVLCVILFGLLAYWLIFRNSMSFFKRLGLNLIIAGGISNLIDRLLFECITDMISISIFGTHLFTCNLADIFISIGFIFYIVSGNKKPKPAQNGQSFSKAQQIISQNEQIKTSKINLKDL